MKYEEGDIVIIKRTGQYCSGKSLEIGKEYKAEIVYYKRNPFEYLSPATKKVQKPGANEWYITFKIDEEYALFAAHKNKDYILRKENSDNFPIY